MPAVSILAGIYTDQTSDLRTAYPVNLVPVPTPNGVSEGYLRPADGIVQNGTGPGTDRGGIVWDSRMYRVLGTKFCYVDPLGAVTVIADVGAPDPAASSPLCTFDYSFDRLAIASGGRLYYFKDGAVTQVTDPDLGYVVDVVWVDGYFMTTDGASLIVTDLNDPYQVNPLKYGSSEADPDPVIALLKLRNEIYALNRFTIEVFDNVGTQAASGVPASVVFPFQRIEGAQIQKGCVGDRASCVFVETVAFVGQARNEAPCVYLGVNGNAVKISTRQIDQELAALSSTDLAGIVVETRNDNAHEHLYIHLPDRTLVYDHTASQETKTQIWFMLTSSLTGFARYRARSMLWAYGQWCVADPTSDAVGYMTTEVGSHYGQVVRCEVSTAMMYNESKGAIVSALELVAITGNAPAGENPLVSTSYSNDGRTWSIDHDILAGKQGQRNQRLVWRRQGFFRSFRIQRFRWDTRAHISPMRLELTAEPLAY